MKKLAGFLKPSSHLIRTLSVVRVRLSGTLAASRRASAIKGDLLQPDEAIGNAAAQSCIFLIDYRHSNMMHSVPSVSLCLLGSLFHHTMPPESSAGIE